MAKLLVIEDEPDVRKVMEYNLVLAGHEVVTAGDGRQGLRLAREMKPDLVLLDLMLPDLSGTEVCRAIRSDQQLRMIPVLVVSALGAEIDRVVGFELGVDDYVTKPFSVRELVLRVRAILRRGTNTNVLVGAIEFGCLRVDREAHRVWVGPAEVSLTALEFKLLITLYERRDRVQSRDALLDQVWGMETRISTRTVDAHVKRLREKLGAARDYIETVRGIGYRFTGVPPAS
jgi:two-component system phosphate regulon response regulator PhoB